jgi:hypothetical protein
MKTSLLSSDNSHIWNQSSYTIIWYVHELISPSLVTSINQQQLRSPARFPPQHKLRSFTVRYQRIHRREHVNRLCAWIRRAVTHSPLERLCLNCENAANEPSNSGANISFDGLVSHLARKHFRTLRFLHIKSSFVGLASLKHLSETCVKLEELSITIGINSLVRIIFRLPL